MQSPPRDPSSVGWEWDEYEAWVDLEELVAGGLDGEALLGTGLEGAPTSVGASSGAAQTTPAQGEGEDDTTDDEGEECKMEEEAEGGEEGGQGEEGKEGEEREEGKEGQEGEGGEEGEAQEKEVSGPARRAYVVRDGNGRSLALRKPPALSLLNMVYHEEHHCIICLTCGGGAIISLQELSPDAIYGHARLHLGDGSHLRSQCKELLAEWIPTVQDGLSKYYRQVCLMP